MDRVALAEATSEELTDAVRQLGALEAAVRAALLELVLVCEERKVWVEDGAPSLESWLSMQLGVAWRTSAEICRVARAGEDLPALSSLFSSGAISWDKLRALATVATPDDEAEWASCAPETSVSHLERAARRHRERDEAERAQAKEGQGLTFRQDRHRPVTHIRGCAPNDLVAAIQRAVEREADKVPPNPETGVYDSYASRRMDALHKICSQALGADSDADRATVILHQGEDGSVSFADGTGIPDSVAEAMRCDCREQHPDGTVRAVVSAALRRKLIRTYGGCTFPGCEQKRWLHIHHIVRRADGGPTEEWNLRPRCGFDHHKVHQPGWREEFGEDGEVRIFRPDGTVVEPPPPAPLRPDLRERLDGWLYSTDPDPPDPEWDDSS